jgi:hypothetical protein
MIVMPENITVTDGDLTGESPKRKIEVTTSNDVTETCDVQETYSYYGDTVAKVEGDTISGFVVVE